MTDVNEKVYQFTVFTLFELSDAMRMISDQAMKHNGNAADDSQFLLIANTLNQLDASINGIRRKDIKEHSKDAIAPEESDWGEEALVIDPLSMHLVLDKLDDGCDRLKSLIRTQKAVLRHNFCQS